MTGFITRGRVEGTWYLRVELPRAADGKRRQRRETVRGDKKEAERRLRTLLREVETGGYADGGRMTIADLCTRWLTATEHRVAARTFEHYAGMIRLYVIPAVGSIKAEALRPAHVETALAAWIAGNRKDQVKGRLSSRSVKHILDTLKTACRWGVRMGLLVRNPVDATPVPIATKIGSCKSEPSAENPPTVSTPRYVKQLAKGFQRHRCHNGATRRFRQTKKPATAGFIWLRGLDLNRSDEARRGLHKVAEC